MVIDTDILHVQLCVLLVIKSLTDCTVSPSANNLPVSATGACRQLEDVGHTSAPSVWVGLDVAFRVWPH